MGWYADAAAQLAASILLPIVGTATVAARFAFRISRKAGLGPDDWFCIPALICVWGCAAMIYWGVAAKVIGYHEIQASSVSSFKSTVVEQATIVHKVTYAFMAWSFPALGFAKLSILSLYRRIFRGKYFNIITWALIALASIWTIVFFFLWTMSCAPHFEYFWGTIEDVSHCVNIFTQWTWGSGVDLAMDVFIICLPVVQVWKLQLPRLQRIALIGVFLTGAISIGAGIVRFVATEEVASSQNNLTGGRVLGILDTDSLGACSIILLFTMVETGVAVIAICLPTLRPGNLVKIFVPWISSIRSHKLSDRDEKFRTSKTSSSGQRSVQYNGYGKDPHKDPTQDYHSETELNTIGYQREFIVRSDSNDEEARTDDFQKRYDEVFVPVGTAKVEAQPKETV